MKTKYFAILVVLLLGAAVLAPAVGNVVGIEAGYGYLSSSREMNPNLPHGVLSSLSYGYVIHDKAKSMTILSLIAGYEWFPQAVSTSALHTLVYGVEYAHTLFKQNPVALLLDYGLLFNLLLQANREGYAFGHHTRLGVGAVYSLSSGHKLSLKGSYNIVTFPYFETAATKYSYPAISLRYMMFF